jgi:hypothetical protein
MRRDLQLSEGLQSLLDETCKALVAKAISELQINRLKGLNGHAYCDFRENIKKTLEKSLDKSMKDRLREEEK